MLRNFAFKRYIIMLGVCLLLLGVTVSLMSPARAATPSYTLFGDAQLVSPGHNSSFAVQLRSIASSGTPFGGIDFHGAFEGLTFSQIQTLSTDYNFTHNSCGGGSPRFSVTVDSDNDGDSVPDSSDGDIEIFIGPSPNFTNCPAGWQNTGNLIGNNDPGRYDASHVGGSPFTTYNSAVALAGSYKVLAISLIVDGGFSQSPDFVQTVLIDNTTINTTTFTYEPSPLPPPTAPSPSPSPISTLQLVQAPLGSACFAPVQPSPHPRHRGRPITTTTTSQPSTLTGPPHLVIAPSKVARSPAGCVVFVVMGTGFSPNKNVVVTAGGLSVTVQTDALGNFSILIHAIVVGPVLTGTVLVMAIEPSPGADVWAVLTVI